MNKIRLSLFWKFAIAIVIIVVIFGSLNIKLLIDSIYEINEYEKNKREMFVANVVASRALEPFIYGDIVNLNKLIEEIKSLDNSIAYILILDDKNEVLAHTFQSSIPKELVGINKLDKDKDSGFLLIKNEQNQLIRDIAIPLMESHIGVVRIGMLEHSIRTEIKKMIENLLMMIMAFLFIGIIGAFFFSYYITQPIRNIAGIANKMDLNVIKESSAEDFKIKRMLNRFERIILVNDEIDLLINKFNEMLNRLKTTSVELEKAQMSLFQNEKLASIGILASGVAHEINTPIAGLLYSIKRIKKDPENLKQTINYLDLMEESAQNINVTVQALLNFSRKYDFQLAEVDIKELIEKVLLVIAFKMETAQISISKEFCSKGTSVLGSQNHLEQVFINILLNSIHAIIEMQKKNKQIGGHIDIKVKQAGIKTFIKIKDNGIGMPKENLLRIFDPFFTTKDVGEGTGLGLSVSYNIIKAHKGNIEVSSEVNKGTSIKIILNTFYPKNT